MTNLFSLLLLLLSLLISVNSADNLQNNTSVFSVELLEKLGVSSLFYFEGEWHLKSRANPFSDYLPSTTQDSGRIVTYLGLNKTTPKLFFKARAYDGFYKDTESLYFNISTTNFAFAEYNNKTSILKLGVQNGTLAPLKKILFDPRDEIANLRLATEVDFSQLNSNVSDILANHDAGKMNFNIKIISSDEFCDDYQENPKEECIAAEYEASVVIQLYSGTGILLFFCFVMILGFTKIKYTLNLLKFCLLEENQSRKISLLTLGMILTWNFDLNCYSELITDKLPPLVRTPVSIVLWGQYAMDIIILGLVSRRNYELRNSGEVSCIWKWVGYCLISFYLIYTGYYLFYVSDFFKLVLCFAFVPQILKNAFQDDLIPFKGNSLLIGSCISYIFMLYYKGFTNNLMHFSPSLSFCAILCLAFIIQIIVLRVQETKGTRFFIPRFLRKYLPNGYKYLLAMKAEIELENNDETLCAICLAKLTESVTTQSTLQTSLIMESIGSNSSHILKVPCGHKFHADCIIGWIEIKKECPVCRAKINHQHPRNNEYTNLDVA